MLLHQDHTTVVYALAFSPDGETLASGDKCGALLLRDAEGRVHPLCETGPKPTAIHAVAHLPNGGVAIGHATGWYVYNPITGGFNPPKSGPTTSLAMLDAKTLAVGTGDRSKGTTGAFELWDLSTGLRREPFFREPNGVQAVAVCPAKKMVAWATGHKKISVWDTTRQSPTHFTQQKTSPAIALSPDGSLLAAAEDWTLRLYDLAKKQVRRVLTGHRGIVTSVAFSPDGATVATGSWDHTVRLWDAATGKELRNFQWSVGRVMSLAYAPDGFRIAAGSDTGAVVVWDTD
jgi:WD40 repeat protein